MRHPFRLCILILCFSCPLFAQPQKTGDSVSKFHDMGVDILNSLVHKNIPREFNFDGVDVSFASGIGVDIKNLRMSENKAFLTHPLKTDDAFFRSRNVHARVKVLPLFIAKVHMHEMNISQPIIHVIRNEKGHFSIEDLFQERKGPVLDWLNVDTMDIRGAVVSYADATPKGPPLKILFDEMDMNVSGFSLKRDFRMDATLKAPGAEKKSIFLQGRAGPIKDSVNFQKVPVDMRLKIETSPIRPYIALIPKGLPIPLSGDMSALCHVKGNMWSGMQMKGNFSIEDLVLTTEDGKFKSVPFYIGISSGENLILSGKEKKITLTNGHVALNKTSLFMNGAIGDYAGNPDLNFDISAPYIDLDDIKKIHPIQEKYLPKGLNYSGCCNAEMNVSGTKERLGISAKLDITHAIFEVPGLVVKNKPSRQIFDFNAIVYPGKKSVEATGNIDFGEMMLTSPEIIESVQNEFLLQIKSDIQRIRLLKLRKDRPMLIQRLKGVIRYAEDILTVRDVQITGLRQKETAEEIDAIVSGAMNMKKEVLDIQGEMIFSPEDSMALLESGGIFRTMHVDENRKMHVLIRISGGFETPKVDFRAGG